MRTALMTCAMLVLLAQQTPSTNAQGGGHVFRSYGPPAESCGSWVAATASEKSDLRWWTLGFVTGADFARPTPLSATDSKGIEVWLDKYCGEHPLSTFNKAAIDLVTELGKPK